MRGLTAPGVWDYRTCKVRIIKRVWAGGEAGADGGKVDTVLLDMPQQYKVVGLSDRYIAASGGRFDADALKVGPITPAYTIGAVSGGVTPAQLDPAPTTASKGTEIIYVLSGAIVGEYRLIQLVEEKSVSYYIYLNRTRVTP